MSNDILTKFYAEEKPELAEYGCSGDTWSKEHPILFEFFARQCVDEEKRETARLSLWVAGGLVHVCLADRQSKQVCFAEGTTLSASMDTLEAKLQDGIADWRPDRNKTPF